MADEYEGTVGHGRGAAMRLACTIFALALLLSFAALPAVAENCQLKMVASVDTEAASSVGEMLLPVSFGGTRKLLLVDTGGFFHEMRSDVVKELNLVTRESQIVAVRDVLNNSSSLVARAPAFSIGAMAPTPMDFVVTENHGLLGDDRVAGVFVPGIYYRSLDVDLNFPAHKFSLFTQDHCPGQVVYWPNSGVAVVPFRFDGSNHVVIPVKVDGNELAAAIDSGASQTTMFLRSAGRLGIEPGKPGVVETGQLGDNANVRTYQYTFGSISIEGITIRNPRMDLLPDLGARMPVGPSASGNDTRLGTRRQDVTDMLIGMSVLRHLHVYIAAKEQKLYITAGAEPAAAAATPMTTTTSTTSTKQ